MLFKSNVYNNNYYYCYSQYNTIGQSYGKQTKTSTLSIKCFSISLSFDLTRLFTLWFSYSTLPMTEGTELFLYRFVLQRCKETPVRSKSPSVTSLLFSSVQAVRPVGKNKTASKQQCEVRLLSTCKPDEGCCQNSFFPFCTAVTSVQHFLSL